MVMKQLSQRDPQWRNQQLGSSSTTIGSHGCLITAIAMATNLTPPEVNDRLNSVGGYQNGNLVIWGAINNAISHAQFVWRGYSYDNSEVSKSIERNGFCLVEVDFQPETTAKEQHWVLYVGNQEMIDPWDGRKKKTNIYPATGYAIIDINETQEKGNGMESLLKKYNVQGIDELDQKIEENLGTNWGSEEKGGGHLGAERRKTTILEKELKEAKGKLRDAAIYAERLEAENEGYEAEAATLENLAEGLQVRLQTYEVANTVLREQLDECENQEKPQRPEVSSWRGNLEDILMRFTSRKWATAVVTIAGVALADLPVEYQGVLATIIASVYVVVEGYNDSKK